MWFRHCVVWGVVFYGPCASQLVSFNYENGRQPGFVVGMCFSMPVVVGNVIMYGVLWDFRLGWFPLRGRE